MDDPFERKIAAALGDGFAPNVEVETRGAGELRSCFRVSDLAVACVAAAARELAALVGAKRVTLNRRHALMWFDMTVRPIGWRLPSAWDPIAGDYRTADGWIRLHTNAPHHREAALGVLGCGADERLVAEAVEGWGRTALEDAVVAAGGAAAAMHGLDEWARSPVGGAVAAEPLIDWRRTDAGAAAGTADRGAGLEGCRVLDLTRVLAGPVATRFLAGFGARVLRVDPPDWTEPGVEPEVTLGKRRTGLDLHWAEDRRTFERLLGTADVLVHGYRPGALEGLGYGVERRRSLAPGLIDVGLNAYGWTSAWSTRRGFDSLVQMSCGIADEGMRRAGAERPVPLPVQALDHATGYLMAAAVLRALRLFREGGERWSARLSLARTAALLTSEGARAFDGDGIAASLTDLMPDVERTGWGPARRVSFPVTIDGNGPCWAAPSGPLRVDRPCW